MMHSSAAPAAGRMPGPPGTVRIGILEETHAGYRTRGGQPLRDRPGKPLREPFRGRARVAAPEPFRGRAHVALPEPFRGRGCDLASEPFRSGAGRHQPEPFRGGTGSSGQLAWAALIMAASTAS